MKALDTNVIVRFLVNDDKTQAQRVRSLFETAEAKGDQFLVTTVVVLETIWVLKAAYDFTRGEILLALELLTEIPILEFEDYDGLQQLIRLAQSIKADLPDLVIGLAGRRQGVDATLTLEKGLVRTGLFEQV